MLASPQVTAACLSRDVRKDSGERQCRALQHRALRLTNGCSVLAGASGKEVHEGAPAQGKQDKGSHDSAVSPPLFPSLWHTFPFSHHFVQLQPAGGGKRKQEAKKEQGTQVQVLIAVFQCVFVQWSLLLQVFCLPILYLCQKVINWWWKHIFGQPCRLELVVHKCYVN